MSKLNEFIEKGKLIGGLLKSDMVALETKDEYKHMKELDKIEWIRKACDNATYSGLHEAILLEKEVENYLIGKYYY